MFLSLVRLLVFLNTPRLAPGAITTPSSRSYAWVNKVDVVYIDGPPSGGSTGMGSGIIRTEMFTTNKFGRFNWYLQITPKHNEITILRFVLKYVTRIPSPSLSFGLPAAPSALSDPRFISDDNEGAYWGYALISKVKPPRDEEAVREGGDTEEQLSEELAEKEMSAIDVQDTLLSLSGRTLLRSLPTHTADWMERAPSFMRHGQVWNQDARVRFVGRDNSVDASTPAKYSVLDGGVSFIAPLTEDGAVDLYVTLNGRDYTTDEAIYTFDSRYELAPPLPFIFRIAPDQIFRAKLLMPFNLIGRRQFDRRLVFDISETLGVSRDRIVVREVHRFLLM